MSEPNRMDTHVVKLENRLNRIEGQIRGIKGLIQKEVYCDDILIQISAVQAALSGVAKELFEKHLRFCAAERIASGDTAVMDELMITIKRLK
ncbi:metal-sensitive transcriptional regulator [Ectobacillus antri]|jgi:DNA-binding FrmR family transcriptional regulator|uniref:Metal-sensitive transcriptional regulator n=1 Tax=Ectobacillus antri TaxID=2486280 RepID=A0ABT6H348_9BACI|nr:metal-sensitive transcriptional regulator [Ectobacillus antri]MDG4657511.1 metal-sensitive transcriptional regulator [Ectobacillus antri]MDG5753824.1 metal-sensitive transcriptional regulator [Ectobacillus antri]